METKKISKDKWKNTIGRRLSKASGVGYNRALEKITEEKEAELMRKLAKQTTAFIKILAKTFTKEICIVAAVKTKHGLIVRGQRHADCYSVITGRMGYDIKDHLEDEEGFITSTGRFVDRKEGLKLQLAAKIPSHDPDGYRNELFSEDLY